MTPDLIRPQLAAWTTFYVIVGAAAAALIGLQFVVMALIADIRHDTNRATISAFGTPTVVHFTGAMLTAAIVSAPWGSVMSASIAVAVCALAGFAYAIRVTYRARHQKGYDPLPEDWVWYVILPCVLYATLSVAALVLPSHVEAGLFVVGAVALALLLLGIRNSWDTVTHIVSGHSDEEPDRSSTV